MIPKHLSRFPPFVKTVCSRTEGKPWREYVRVDGGWVDKGPCKHDHPDPAEECCCGRKDCEMGEG